MPPNLLIHNYALFSFGFDVEAIGESEQRIGRLGVEADFGAALGVEGTLYGWELMKQVEADMNDMKDDAAAIASEYVKAE